jgi:hypothetical protein
MIKIITLITQFILVVLTALLFGSCNFTSNFNGITGSGTVTTEKRNVTGTFRNVEVNNSIDLVIEQSEKTEVTVVADDNLQNGIITKVENGTLVITCKYNNFYKVQSKKVIVKMPVIEGLQASGAASVKSKNVLKGENINLNTSSAASMEVTIESEAIICDVSSGSNITINGKALKIETSASSGGSIDATNLLANEVIVQASSGGSVNVHPIVSLRAKASSGGDIVYNTAPKIISKEESSGGSISKE